MEPLDLTQAPPRSTRTQIPGIDCPMIARSIDKLRATLPGGNIGAYKIAGTTAMLLDGLGIAQSDLCAAIASAKDDREVAGWIAEHTTPQRLERVKEGLESARIADRAQMPGFFDRYPIARTLAEETPLLDMLDHDDRAAFA